VATSTVLTARPRRSGTASRTGVPGDEVGGRAAAVQQQRQQQQHAVEHGRQDDTGPADAAAADPPVNSADRSPARLVVPSMSSASSAPTVTPAASPRAGQHLRGDQDPQRPSLQAVDVGR